MLTNEHRVETRQANQERVESLFELRSGEDGNRRCVAQQAAHSNEDAEDALANDAPGLGRLVGHLHAIHAVLEIGHQPYRGPVVVEGHAHVEAARVVRDDVADGHVEVGLQGDEAGGDLVEDADPGAAGFTLKSTTRFRHNGHLILRISYS